MNYQISKLPSHEHGKVNKVYIQTSHNPDTVFIVIKGYFFAFENTNLVPKDKIAMSNAQREFLSVILDGSITVSYKNKNELPPISLLRITLEMINLGTHQITRSELSSIFKQMYKSLPFNKNQIFYFITDELTFKAIVNEIITTQDIDSGIVFDSTNVYFTNNSPKLTLLGGDDNSLLLRNDFSFENLGIGGLKKEFSIMFRRAFVQRIFDSDTIQKLGIPHVKGILLYGPPGTGKTLIARQIGSLLNARPPKIVNGPEILNKYVGQSEENIRNLFTDAEEEYKKLKDKSPLHIIIFDELDAIFKSRGSTSNNIGDQVVNQLLSKMDGVEALDNVLIIGMTNRPDLIDKALLRPGRFEIHIEISLPDEESRLEIFKIHTKEMKKSKFLDDGVDFKQMAKLTRNYTGAEICALVKSAASFALEKQIKNTDLNNNTEQTNQLKADKNICITMNDFVAALEEVKPSFGLNEEDFAGFMKTHYELPCFVKAFDLGAIYIEKLKNKTPPKTLSLLLYGMPGTGKTFTSVKIALSSNFPYVKIISPKHMIGLSEYEKVNYIKEQFMDAYKSEESVVILDEIESLIEYVAIGPRFSSSILHAIKLFIKREEKNKVFVIGTTSEVELLTECGIANCFDDSCQIDLVNDHEYELLCVQNESFRDVVCDLPAPIRTLMSLLDEPVKMNK